MLGDWAGVNNEDNGVSIEATFSKYDRYYYYPVIIILYLYLYFI